MKNSEIVKKFMDYVEEEKKISRRGFIRMGRKQIYYIIMVDRSLSSHFLESGDY